MYNNQQSFSDEIVRIWPRVASIRPHWYQKGGLDRALEIRDAWELYRHASNSNLSELLLGDVKLRSHLEILKNFGTTSGTESTMERGTLFPPPEKNSRSRGRPISTAQISVKIADPQDKTAHIRSGSVLNDGWWWPFKNDAWVIGGIQGTKRFHLALSKVPDDLLWDSRANRPRVLGRELLGLACFGYKLIGAPNWTIGKGKKERRVSATSVRNTIGYVFSPISKDQARQATFTEYYDYLGRVNSIDQIKEIFNDEVAFDDYDYADA